MYNEREVDVVCSECEGGEDDADIRELLHQGGEPGLAHHGAVPGAEGLEVEGLGELSRQLYVLHLELGANIMTRLGAEDSIPWSPEAEVSVTRRAGGVASSTRSEVDVVSSANVIRSEKGVVSSAGRLIDEADI